LTRSRGEGDRRAPYTRTMKSRCAFVMAVALAVSGPAFGAGFVIDGLDGPPTANELASLTAGLKVDYRGPVLTCDASPCGPYNVFVGNHHNNYVYGETGGALEG